MLNFERNLRIKWFNIYLQVILENLGFYRNKYRTKIMQIKSTICVKSTLISMEISVSIINPPDWIRYRISTNSPVTFKINFKINFHLSYSKDTSTSLGLGGIAALQSTNQPLIGSNNFNRLLLTPWLITVPSNFFSWK